SLFFFFQAEDGIRDFHVTGVQTCALPIYHDRDDLQDDISVLHQREPSVCHSPSNRRCKPNISRSSSGSAWSYPSRCRIPWVSSRSEERRVGKEGRSGSAAEQ